MYFDSLTLKVTGRNHSYDIKQNIRILLEKQGTFVFDHSIKLLTVRFRNSVPKLWLAIMVVIDGMQHQIFKMPTECGILHSDIHPRDVYTRNLLDIRELKKRILPFLKVSKIPRVVQIRF